MRRVVAETPRIGCIRSSLLYHFEFTDGDDFAIDIQVGVIE